jgi:hypothetical protein
MACYQSGISNEPLNQILTGCLTRQGKRVVPESARLAQIHPILFGRS